MQLKNLLQSIEQLNEIGIALSAEHDPQRLLEMITIGAKTITNADGGTLYLVDGDHVRMEIVRTDSLNFAMGGTTTHPIPFPPIPLFDEQGAPNTRTVVTSAVLNNRTINIPDAYNADGFDFSGTRQFDHKTGYRSRSFLTVPMKNHDGDIIGVLQLLNAMDPATGAAIPFSAEAQRLTESLASQAAIALTNQRLIDELHHLFEALIRLIAEAIDEKSPYTGGHCRRVSALTTLLADAAHRSQEGPLKAFSMTDADRYELEIAAWLHDCGKITTPEYVVDKATKLEGVVDRIALIDARFELLKHEAQVEHLRRRVVALEAGESPPRHASESELTALYRELDAERDFLHRCNRGTEFMAPEDQARVRAIGQREWHDSKGQAHPLLTLEEIQNLTILRGTLNEAERRIINNHVSATIRMLEALPFPKHLKRVPEFAGGHHERVDGKGYPRGLTREQMSVQARIMAIADIFEALTAGDRPYKPAKKLSEALTIMRQLAHEGHIDPDLFELFMRDRVYEIYAREHLPPDQHDVAPVREQSA